MSIDTSHVALADEAQLHQMIGNPDPRVSIPAAARLAKMLQERKSQQNQQAMAAQTPPTVREQLTAAAAPPPPTGIAQAAPGVEQAMAAGGQVQRHFWGGGVGFTNDSNTDDGEVALEKANAVRSQYPGPGRADANIDPDTAALVSGLVAQSSGMQPNLHATPPKAAAQKATPSLPRASDQPAVATGIAAGVSPSGPPNGTKVAAASEGDAPEETYRDRAEALQAKLDPLYEAQLANNKQQQDTENTRYAGLQAAQNLPWYEKLSRLGHQLSGAAYNPDGSPAINHGMADLGRLGNTMSVDRQKNDQAVVDQRNKHQIVLDGLQSGATELQIKQALAQYNQTNTAVGADDKTDLNDRNATIKEQAAELAQARLDETTRLDNARIGKLNAGAAGGKGVAGPKPMTEAQIQTAAQKDVHDAISTAAQQGVPMSTADAQQLYLQQYKLHKGLANGTVQSDAPAAPAAAPSGKWGQIQRK